MPELFDAFNRPLPQRKRTMRNAPGGYQSAGWSYDRAHILSTVQDSSQDINSYTRNEIDRRARWLVKNVGLVKGIVLDFQKYVIGPGIFPYANTGDEKIDEAYDEWFYEYFAPIADLGERMSFWDMQRAREFNRFVSGDVFTALTETPGGFPKLKLIRAHNCCSENGDDVFEDGVRIYGNGAARSYKFKQRDGSYKIMGPRTIDHSMILEAGDEIRQVSSLQGAILHSQDALEILGYEKLAVKDHARISRIINRESTNFDDERGEGPGGDFLDDASDVLAGNAGSIPLDKVQGGELIRLGLGEKMQSFASDRPSTTFTGFLEFLGREIFASTGWRYEFSWSPAGIPGTAIRQILDSVKRTAHLRQQCEIRSTHRLRNYAISRAIERGELPRHDKWWKADYIPGAQDPTVDRGRDGKLDIQLIESGLMTRKEYFGCRGQHWRKVKEQIEKEAEHFNAPAEDPTA